MVGNDKEIRALLMGLLEAGRGHRRPASSTTQDGRADALLRLRTAAAAGCKDEHMVIFREVWTQGIAKGYLYNRELSGLLHGADALGIAEAFVETLMQEEGHTEDDEGTSGTS